MTSLQTAKSHYRRLVGSLQKSDPNVVKLHHETFKGHVERGEFVSLSEGKRYDPSRKYVSPIFQPTKRRQKETTSMLESILKKMKMGNL